MVAMIILPIFQVRGKWMAQGLDTGKQQSWDSYFGLSDPKIWKMGLERLGSEVTFAFYSESLG